MSGKLFIMAGMAVVFGATSYVAGTHYLESQTEARMRAIEDSREPIEQVELAKVVVATRELKFGDPIPNDALKVVDWPKDAFPEGAFAAVGDVVQDGKRRVITPMQPGEPILAIKITGEEGRAGLAGIIAEGMRAVTIPVDTVNGVGGFVQPGDRVDLILTKKDESSGTMAADVILENVRVLSVDQEAVDRSATARIANSVTLETNTKGAQRIALALRVGRISLLLRGANDVAEDTNNIVEPLVPDSEALSALLEEEAPTKRAIKLVEGRNITRYTVSIENPEAEFEKQKQKENQ